MPESELVTCSFFRQDSPLGRLWVFSTERGVCRVAFGDRDGLSAVETLGAQPAPDAQSSRVRREIDAYFDSGRHDPDVRVDLRSTTDFSRRVLRTLRARVPPGRTVTYGGLARLVGRPGAARAVGRAVGANPVPILVPCHRVVASDGTLGGFGGGLALKRRLLAIEGIPVPPGGWVVAARGRGRPGPGRRR